LPRPSPQRGKYRLNENVENVSHQPGIVSKPVAQCERQ
jgi:hypothetical protein